MPRAKALRDSDEYAQKGYNDSDDNGAGSLPVARPAALRNERWDAFQRTATEPPVIKGG